MKGVKDVGGCGIPKPVGFGVRSIPDKDARC